MNIIVEKFLGFFEKNGMIKLLVAFVLLILSIIFFKQYPHVKLFTVTAWIGIGYIGLVFILFFGATIINSMKDLIKWIKEKRSK